MSDFDPFGQRTRTGAATKPAAPEGKSSWLTRAGSILFWTLVAVILAARAAYFVPAFAQRFDAFSALFR